MKGYTNIYGEFFDGDKRNASTPLINAAVKEGTIPAAKESPCKMCGQMEGIKHTHCEDYNDPVGDATTMCFRCHMMWHSRFRDPASVFRYVYEVTVMKKQYPPIYKFDFSILSKDHGLK